MQVLVASEYIYPVSYLSPPILYVVVLTMRVYALYEHDPRVLSVMLIVGLGGIAVAFVCSSFPVYYSTAHSVYSVVILQWVEVAPNIGISRLIYLEWMHKYRAIRRVRLLHIVVSVNLIIEIRLLVVSVRILHSSSFYADS